MSVRGKVHNLEDRQAALTMDLNERHVEEVASIVSSRRLGWTKDWFAAYLNEDPQKRNLLAHCKQLLQKIQKENPLPNPLRTAVCCDLLEQVALTLGPHKELVTNLKDELIASIYGSVVLDAADKDLLNRVPFFSELDAMRGKVHNLEDRNAALTKDLNERHVEEEKRLNAKQLRVEELEKKIATLLHQKETWLRESVQAKERAVTAGLHLQLEKNKKDEARREFEEEKQELQTQIAQLQARLDIAVKIVGAHVPKDEVRQVESRLAVLKEQLTRERKEHENEKMAFTPRPSLFRASDYVSIKNPNGSLRPSKDVVDDVCQKLEWYTARYARLEDRLSKPFRQLQPEQVDWFALEEPEVQTVLESIFVSYCHPRKEPLWVATKTRRIAVSDNMMAVTKFLRFVEDFKVLEVVPQHLVVDAFRTATSGKGSFLVYNEFKNCLAIIAIMGWGGEHNTCDDIRTMVTKLVKRFGLHDGEAVKEKLLALEAAYCLQEPTGGPRSLAKFRTIMGAVEEARTLRPGRREEGRSRPASADPRSASGASVQASSQSRPVAAQFAARLLGGRKQLEAAPSSEQTRRRPRSAMGGGDSPATAGGDLGAVAKAVTVKARAVTARRASLSDSAQVRKDAVSEGFSSGAEPLRRKPAKTFGKFGDNPRFGLLL